MTRIKEINCKSILNKSRLFDYCLNPYTGCQHGCVYCYAMFMARYSSHSDERWGSWTDAKVNAADILREQIKKAEIGKVWISSVTDPYQPIEKEYRLTRELLKILLERQFPVFLQTKNAMVMRDIDLLKRFKDISVAFSISFFDDRDRKVMEPFASTIDERFEALKRMKDNGIDTSIFFGPAMPYISDRCIEKLFDRFREATNLVYFDRLNIKSGNWACIEPVIKKYYPGIHDKFREAVFGNSYYPHLKSRVKDLADERKLKIYYCC